MFAAAASAWEAWAVLCTSQEITASVSQCKWDKWLASICRGAVLVSLCPGQGHFLLFGHSDEANWLLGYQQHLRRCRTTIVQSLLRFWRLRLICRWKWHLVVLSEISECGCGIEHISTFLKINVASDGKLWSPVWKSCLYLGLQT